LTVAPEVYVQVTHVKNKWKCVLRSAVMSIDGDEFVVGTASGLFTF
jgi:hypothetical protein